MPEIPTNRWLSSLSRNKQSSCCWAFLALGCGLRLIQYVANTSQWVDEAMLSTSIVSRDIPRLIAAPLDYGQAAPAGWLLSEKLVTLIFGRSDLALRFLPWASSVAALFLCLALARRFLLGAARPVAMALVAFAAPLIGYSAQVKQYSSDVALALLLLLLASHLNVAGSMRQVWAASVGGAAAVWCSNSALLVIGGLSLGLAWSAWSERGKPDRRPRWQLVLVVVIWSLSALWAVLEARATMSSSVRQMLYRYWANGFMPAPAMSFEAVRWLLRSVTRVFGGVESAGLWYPMNQLYAVLMACGFVALGRRSLRDIGLLLGPVAVTLLAAVARQYPFLDRLVLFLVPSMLFATAEGIVWLANLFARVHPLARLPSIVALCVAPLYPVTFSLPPYGTEDMKAALGYLALHHKPGDRIYVYHAAAAPFLYYASDYSLQPGTYDIGACHYGNSRGYLAELDRLRGQARVWVVISHALPVYDDRQSILSYLDAVGVRRGERLTSTRVPAHSGVWALTAETYLYDLSDTSRLKSTSASLFPLPSMSGFAGHFRCD